MVFGLNTMSDNYFEMFFIISRAIRRVNFETILKYYGWYFMPRTLYHVQFMLLFVYTTTHKRFVIFTCRYFESS